MLPASRSEKLALAKDKLNKFQKSRTKTSASIVLESAVIGTTVNGQHMSSMMSSHGGSSSQNGGLKSASGSSSPQRNFNGAGKNTGYPSTVLSPIRSEGALSQGLLKGLENLKIAYQ